MSARYRIKEHKSTYTPQKRVLGMWWRIAKPQTSMQAASEIIRGKLKASHPQPHPEQRAH
jgi:Tfp pilus assembly protein PilF